MSNATDIIDAARTRLTDPEQWTQKAIARKSNESPCGTLSAFAVKWDIYGAMEKAKEDLGHSQSDLNEAAQILRARRSRRRTLTST